MATDSKRAGEGEVLYGDTEIRVRRAEFLLAKQYSGGQVARLLAKEFECVERTARTYVAIAYDRMQASFADDRGIQVARALAAWQRRMRRCEEKGDEDAANYALDRICKIVGAYAPKKIEVSGAIGIAVEARAVVSVLDAAGLAALQVVLEQLEKAGVKPELPGMTPTLSLPLPDEVIASPEVLQKRKRKTKDPA